MSTIRDVLISINPPGSRIATFGALCLCESFQDSCDGTSPLDEFAAEHNLPIEEDDVGFEKVSAKMIWEL